MRRLHHLNLFDIAISNHDLIVDGVFESLVTLEECDERHVEHIMHQVLHLISHSIAFLGLNGVEVLLRRPDYRDCSFEARVLNKNLLYGIWEFGRQLYDCLQELIPLNLHLVPLF